MTPVGTSGTACPANHKYMNHIWTYSLLMFIMEYPEIFCFSTCSTCFLPFPNSEEGLSGAQDPRHGWATGQDPCHRGGEASCSARCGGERGPKMVRNGRLVEFSSPFFFSMCFLVRLAWMSHVCRALWIELDWVNLKFACSWPEYLFGLQAPPFDPIRWR